MRNCHITETCVLSESPEGCGKNTGMPQAATQEKSNNPLATPLSYILSPHDPQVQSFRLTGFKHEPVSQDRSMKIEAPDLLFRHKLHLSCRAWPLEAFGKNIGMQGPYDIYNIQVSPRPPKTLCSVANRVSAFNFLPACW